jgi:hypothetical protein
MTTSTTTLIAAMLDQDMSRDLIIITLVTDQAMTLNAATKAYADYARANGMTAKVVSHKEAAMGKLASEYPVWDHVAVTEAVVVLADCYDIAESTARDYTKAYSKLLNVTHPKLDPRAAMFNWLKEASLTSTGEAEDTADMKADFKNFCKSIGRSDSNANEYWKCYEFHMFMQA